MKASFRAGVAALGTILAMGLAPSAWGAAFTVSSTLTGDIRLDNPDNLIVNVTITGDTTSNVTSWVFDINSPAHPNIKLDEFYFNLVAPASNYSFSGYDPSGWDVQSPASVQGAGGTTFLFEALDPAGDPNAADVTNAQNLTFTVTKGSGFFSSLDFLNATTTISNDAGSGQLGAHLQSLTIGGNCGSNCSDSGFAFGNYTYRDNPSSGPVPEPNASSLALLGMGILGATLWMRRRLRSV